MVPAGLTLEQAPPLSVPARFFLTAPLFALLAALVILWRGPEVFDSRWAPETLAIVHLLALGFLAMVMIGALMQMLPVLAGAPVPWPGPVAHVVHAGLTLGTLSLAGGFLFGEIMLLKAAVWLLAIALIAFLAAMAAGLARVRVVNDTVRVMVLVWLAFAVTAVFGLWLAAGRSWGLAPFDWSMRNLHPGWGFFGWTGLLVIGVAYHVVPMFQMTPPYPAAMTRWFAMAVFAALLVWSAGAWQGAVGLALAGALALAVFYAGFALVTLDLQRRRRRRVPDVTLLFWRAGMLSLLVASLAWTASVLVDDPPASLALFLGVAVIAGVVMSVISGMLYKILPFLAWFHLQARTGMGRHVPNMRQYLGEGLQRRQFWLHLASVILLAGAALWPAALAQLAALVLGASAVQLLWNLISVMQTYRRQFLLLSGAAAAP